MPAGRRTSLARALFVQVPCQLPYPDKYKAALEFYYNWPKEAKQPVCSLWLLQWVGQTAVVKHACKALQSVP